MLKSFLIHNNVQSRKEVMNNVTYSVFPVIMMTEGVHAGSGGPVLYTEQALSEFSQTWNGTPVTLGHPTFNGEFVSANHPKFYQESVVGTVFNAGFSDSKLRGEIWLDESKLEVLAPGLLNSLKQGMQLDVSTGLFDTGPEQSGEFNGEPYQAVAANIRPDHLALLPGGSGACSWADGCGVRANEGGGMKRTTTPKGKSGFTGEELKARYEERILTNTEIPIPEDFTQNAKSFQAIVAAIQNKVRGMNIGEKLYHYVVEVYPTYVIYEQEGPERTFFQKRSYSMDKNLNVEWTSDPVEVRREVKFTEIKTNKKKENVMKTMKECCPAKVDELIKANAKFKDEDKEMLLNLTEDGFARVIEMAEPTIKEVVKEVKVHAEPKEHPEEPQSIPEVSFDTLLANADPKTRESIQYGQSLVNRERVNFINRIKTNKANTFTDEELENFDLPMLEKMASLVPTPVNYGLREGGVTPVSNEEVVEPLPETSFTLEPEKSA